MAGKKALVVATQELPEEIIRQIQKRLPVKSLLRFICVSKWWSSVITDPNFAKSHFLLASQNQTLSRRLLLWNKPQFESLDSDNCSFRKLTSPFSRPRSEFHVNLLGSCNGLVFLCVAPRNGNAVGFYIWNPSTGFVRKLPAPSFRYALHDIRKCGFGYVAAADDYKLVLSFVEQVDEDEEQLFFEVFSWRANSWRWIQAPLFEGDEIARDDGCRSKGVVSNGALHWIEMFVKQSRGFVKSASEDGAVLVFDLVTDEFRKLPLPTVDNEKCSWIVGVDSGGCLSAASFVGNYTIQLWVMREYNVPESWTKLSEFRVSKTNAPHVRDSSEMLLHWENSIIMLQSHNKDNKDRLIRYDIQEGKVANGKAKVCSSDIGKFSMINFDLIGYEESLLRPHGYIV